MDSGLGRQMAARTTARRGDRNQRRHVHDGSFLYRLHEQMARQQHRSGTAEMLSRANAQQACRG
jgi:hypothetical protein